MADITSITTAVTTVFTAAMGWAGQVGTAIVASPLLSTFVIIPLVGLGIGIFRRLLNL